MSQGDLWGQFLWIFDCLQELLAIPSNICKLRHDSNLAMNKLTKHLQLRLDSILAVNLHT